MNFKIDAVISAALKSTLQKLSGNLIPDQVRHDIGTLAVAKIKLRTARGVDFMGNAFKPYGAKYAEKRKKKGLPTGKVDLNWTGNMMGALTYNLEGPDTVLIHFSDMMQAKKAHGHNFRPDLKNRRFMGLNNGDVGQINKIIRKGLNIQ